MSAGDATSAGGRVWACASPEAYLLAPNPEIQALCMVTHIAGVWVNRVRLPIIGWGSLPSGSPLV